MSTCDSNCVDTSLVLPPSDIDEPTDCSNQISTIEPQYETEHQVKRACRALQPLYRPIYAYPPIYPRILPFDVNMAMCNICGEERTHPSTYFEGTDPIQLLGDCPVCYICTKCGFQAIHKRVKQIALVNEHGVPTCLVCGNPDPTIYRERVQHLFIHDATEKTPTATFEVIGDELVFRFSCPKSYV